MIYYASRTGTRRNLAAFAAHGWRVLVSARGVLRTEGFPYALDNGAWTSYVRGEPFDEAAFTAAVDLLGAGADWIVCPDVVMGGLDSLAMSLRWLDYVLAHGKMALIPVQNGMTAADIAPHIGPRVGIFVGGDDAFKEETMAGWAKLARSRGAYCHVGRVNTRGRIRLCLDACADSADGSSGSRFAVNVPRIDGWARQTSLISLVNRG